MSASLRARKIALFTLFLVPGMSLSSWVTRTPAIRDAVNASTAEMGLILFGLAAGSMVGLLLAGPLVPHLGARRLITIGMTGVAISMPLIGWGAAISSSMLVAAGLIVFGVGLGSADIAMNVEGADIERVTKRPFLPALHGFFSLGNVVGASAGILLNAVGFSVPLHLLITGAVTLVAVLISVRYLPPATGRTRSRGDRATRAGAPKPRVWRDTRLICIGLIVLAMALVEGTAHDWLPLVMVDGHGFDQAASSAIYTLFTVAMTVGRFAGGPFVFRFGRARVLAVSAISAAAGLAAVALIDSPMAAAVAVFFWGLGASLGFPVAISAAGDAERHSTERVAFVATLGYIAFLVGPPVLGLLGEAVGLRGALLAPMALALIVIPLTALIGGRGRRGAAAER